MGSPRNGNFQREHCDFQHGIVIFCRESLIIDDRDSDGDGFFSELWSLSYFPYFGDHVNAGELMEIGSKVSDLKEVWITAINMAMCWLVQVKRADVADAISKPSGKLVQQVSTSAHRHIDNSLIMTSDDTGHKRESTVLLVFFAPAFLFRMVKYDEVSWSFLSHGGPTPKSSSRHEWPWLSLTVNLWWPMGSPMTKKRSPTISWLGPTLMPWCHGPRNIVVFFHGNVWFFLGVLEWTCFDGFFWWLF